MWLNEIVDKSVSAKWAFPGEMNRHIMRDRTPATDQRSNVIQVQPREQSLSGIIFEDMGEGLPVQAQET